MLTHHQYFPVNWVDGMKISRQNFLDSENAMFDQLRDLFAVQLNASNYGLLPSESRFGDSYRLEFSQGNLVLSACRVITQAGVRIEINDLHPLTPAIQCPLADLKPDTEYHIVVTVDIFHRETDKQLDPDEELGRKPAGMPDAEEGSGRHPFTIPRYNLHIKEPGASLPGQYGFQFLIGKLRQGPSGPEILDYIPACSAISTHSKVYGFFQTVVDQSSKIRLSCIEIVKKANRMISSSGTQKNDRILASGILYVAEKLLFQLANSLDAFEQTGQHMPPIALFTFAQGLSRTIETALACRDDAERDDVIQFFAHVLGEGIGEVKQIFQILPERGSLQYAHTDINRTLLVPIGDVMNKIEQLFQQLAEGQIQWKKQIVRRITTTTNTDSHTVGDYRSRTNRRNPPPASQDSSDGISINKRKNPF